MNKSAEPNGTLRNGKVRPVDLLWLAYLVFFIIEPIQRKSPIYWLECGAIILVFVAMYIAFLRSCSKKTMYVLLLAMWIMGTTTLLMNGGGVTFIIYTAAMMPYAIESVPVVAGLLIFESILLANECWWLHFSAFSIFLNVFFALIVGGSNIFFAQKERADRKLHLAHEEIEALAAVAERERIARDLHDVLGHTLSVIVLKAELAGRLLDASTAANIERARAEIGDVERTGRTALAEVREAIGGYRSKGLLAEIEAARRTLEAAGVRLDSDAVAAKTAGLSASEETVLALALREAVTNIVRHARATTCRLRFATEGAHRRLVVEDNGSHAATGEGNGLRGMRERVEALGGHVELEREGGTRLLIELPLTGLPLARLPLSEQGAVS